jgi:hypothetical protein
MPGYYSKGHGQTTPVMEAFTQNDFSPMSQRPSANAIPTLLGSTARHPSNQSYFREDKLPDGIILLPVEIAPGQSMSRPSVKTTIPQL